MLKLNDWIDWEELGKGRVRLRVFDQTRHLARVVDISHPVDGETPYQVNVQIFSTDPESLESARQLRASGQHEQARELLLKLAHAAPDDAILQYEVACVHDYLGLEAQAVPFYVAALAAQLPANLRRSAYTGLGSTYRTLGMFTEARATLEKGLQEFPAANEMRAFLAMAAHNLGASKQAVESLLQLLISTTSDPEIKAYARAIEFYAQDIERTWPNGVV